LPGSPPLFSLSGSLIFAIAPDRCLSGSLILLASRSVFPSVIDLRRATFEFIFDFGLLISNSPAPSDVPTIMLLIATAVVLGARSLQWIFIDHQFRLQSCGLVFLYLVR
jgi:hypothetical protein